MPTDEQMHQWKNQAKKKVSKLSAGAATHKQVHCAQCGGYATKTEIMSGEREFYRQGNGMWLCSLCHQQAMEWYDEKS